MGVPVEYKNSLYNCAAVLVNGVVAGLVPKIHIANYNEFYEKRWFASGADFKTAQDIEFCGFNTKIGPQLFDLGDGAILGVELCEDLWVPCPPSGELSLSGANIIANLSASDEYASKAQYRRELVSNQSARCICGYVYAGASVFESTTDLLFGGALLRLKTEQCLLRGNASKEKQISFMPILMWRRLTLCV